MPVRSVRNNGGNVIGYFPSLKMQRMIQFESTIEEDYLYLLDQDINITFFEEQPLTIEYTYNSKKLHYTPDFKLLERQREVIVECKPERFVDTDENKIKFEAARSWCQTLNIEFRLVTDRQVRSGYFLKNIKQITYYARWIPTPQIQADIYDVLRKAGGPITLGDMISALAPTPSPIARAALLHLVFHHKLLIPLDIAPLHDHLLLSLPHT